MKKCLVKNCDKEAVRANGQCTKHPPRSIVPRRTHRMGWEQERSRSRVPFPGFGRDVHTQLVESLATAVGNYTNASAVVDALDAYLADPDRVPPLQYSLEYLKSNPRAELDKALKERDEAVARAEKAEQKLKPTPKKRAKK